MKKYDGAADSPLPIHSSHPVRWDGWDMMWGEEGEVSLNLYFKCYSATMIPQEEPPIAITISKETKLT
jgi:hypothetical protein